MNTKSPTHEEISRRARELWQSRGSPVGHDHDIWLAAERELTKPVTAQNAPSATGGRGNGNTQASRTPADPKAKDLKPAKKNAGGKTANGAAETERLKGEMASESEAEFHISPPIPQEEAIKAALQKREARSPQRPKKDAPPVKPTESGKPIWDKPHSA